MKQQDNNPFFAEESDHINIKQEFYKYLRFWPWFVFALILSFAGSYFYLRYATKVYQSIAKIKILGKNESSLSSSFIFKKSNINLENAKETLTSYRTIEHVVKELKLTSVIYEKHIIQTSERNTLPFHYNQVIPFDSIRSTSNFEINFNDRSLEVLDIKNYKRYTFINFNSYDVEHDLPFQIKIEDKLQIKKNIGKKFILSLRQPREVILDLKKSIFVQSSEESDLLELSIEGESPEKSEKILNTLIDVFNKDGINDRQLVSKNIYDFIDKRFIYLAKELDSIEVAKKDFKQSNNLVDLPTDTQLGLEQRIKTDEEVFKIENQLELSAVLKKTLNSDSKYDLLPSNVGLESINVNSLIKEYNSVVLEKDKLIVSAGKNNLTVRSLLSKINDLRENIDKSLVAYEDQLNVSLQQIKSRNQIFKSQVAQVPEMEKRMRAIERQQDIKENSYSLLLKNREEAAINLGTIEPPSKVIEYAISNSDPIAPKSEIIYFGALVIGLLVPFGVLHIIFMLDTKLHSKSDIERIVSDIPVVGEIPEIKKGVKIFKNPNDKSAFAESFKILSLNVNDILPLRKNGNVIYCTSSIKGEGKTFVSLNLSLALSSINKKVLLIDSDLRNPQIHNYLNIERNTDGLSNYLYDIDIDFDWKSSLIKGFYQHPKHDTLISGSTLSNPAYLLANGRFKKLLEEARLLYNYVIVDTVPTTSVADTLLISQFADATICVTRADYTEKDIINASIDLHRKKKLKNMAYVITSVAGSDKFYGYREVPVSLKYTAIAAIIFALGIFGWKAYDNNQYKNQLLVEHQQEIVEKEIKNYHIVAGAFRKRTNTEKKIKQLKAKGFDAQIVEVNKSNLIHVSYASYKTRNEALVGLKMIKETESEDAWILEEKIIPSFQK